jgi:hypothetical protein
VPDGAYRLAAVTEIEVAAWKTREFLEALVPHSVIVTVEEGRESRGDFRIGSEIPAPGPAPRVRLPR